MKLPFNEKDMKEVNEWLKKWDESRRSGRPDWTTDAIYLMPLTIALLKSASTLSRLTWVLIFLTGFLVIERIIWIVRLFR